MKLTVLVTLLMMVGILGLPGLGYSDCSNYDGHCYANAGQGNYLGGVTAGLCWSWRKFTCDWCTGSTEPAGHCNSTYSACQGNCWACNDTPRTNECCYDTQGNSHGYCKSPVW